MDSGLTKPGHDSADIFSEATVRPHRSIGKGMEEQNMTQPEKILAEQLPAEQFPAALRLVEPTGVPAAPAHRRLHEMYFPKHLTAVLRRERARADRQKGQFSLVMFRLVPARGRWATLRLSRMVLNEVRTTDEIGLYDRHTVCAILPDTVTEGAWRLIQRVNDIARTKSMNVEPVLYTYPTNWIDRDKHGGHGKPPTNGHTNETKTNGSDRGGFPESVSARLKIEPKADKPKSVDSSDYPSLPLESLLAKPPVFLKRLIDVVVAGTALIAFSPVIVTLAAIIKFSSPGPIIFRQKRSGMGGHPFSIYKFRTMVVGADKMKNQLRAQSEQDGPAFKMTHDPRVTTIGRLLRKTSLDELPQLLNVLKGDMSLVGPRPLPIDEQAGADQWHQSRLDVRPGLTCVWQVSGRSTVSFEEWMRMDLGYIHRYQVWHDIKLIFQTVPAVLLRRGAK